MKKCGQFAFYNNKDVHVQSYYFIFFLEKCVIAVLENINKLKSVNSTWEARQTTTIIFSAACSLTSSLTRFLTGNLTLSLVSKGLLLETLVQNKLNSTAKLSFKKLSKFRLKPYGFTDLKIYKVSLLKLKNRLQK